MASLLPKFYPHFGGSLLSHLHHGESKHFIAASEGRRHLFTSLFTIESASFHHKSIAFYKAGGVIGRLGFFVNAIFLNILSVLTLYSFGQLIYQEITTTIYLADNPFLSLLVVSCGLILVTGLTSTIYSAALAITLAGLSLLGFSSLSLFEIGNMLALLITQVCLLVFTYRNICKRAEDYLSSSHQAQMMSRFFLSLSLIPLIGTFVFYFLILKKKSHFFS